MCKIEGVDGFIIGPRDLAMRMGYYGGPAHDEVEKVLALRSEKSVFSFNEYLK